MTGTVECLELGWRPLGKKYATIDGQRYVVYADLGSPALETLWLGVKVEFQVRPEVAKDIPGAVLVRVVDR